MNIEEIRSEFLQAFETKRVLKVVLPPDRPVFYKYSIYPLLCLNQLRDVVRIKASLPVYDPNDDDFDANFGLRFVVNLDNQIKFTREGPRGSSVPAHSDIESRVCAAGNLYFSEDYSRIVKITNKSGHFKPNFATLVHAIPLIMASGFPLADVIELSFSLLDEQKTFRFSHEQIQSLIPASYNLEEMMALNQSQEVEIAIKEPRHEPIPSELQFSMKKGLLMTNSSCAAVEESESEDDSSLLFSLFAGLPNKSHKSTPTDEKDPPLKKFKP